MSASTQRKTLIQELRQLRGGVTDTSTLIYLQRLAFLPRAASCFRLVVIPQVVREYGSSPEELVYWDAAPPGPTDQVVCQAAQTLGLPVLSEDGGLLRAARRQNLGHYNTMMLILALCIQGNLPMDAYPALRARLLTFARYRPEIVAVGDAVFAAIAGGGAIGR